MPIYAYKHYAYKKNMHNHTHIKSVRAYFPHISTIICKNYTTSSTFISPNLKIDQKCHNHAHRKWFESRLTEQNLVKSRSRRPKMAKSRSQKMVRITNHGTKFSQITITKAKKGQITDHGISFRGPLNITTKYYCA